MPDPRMYAGQTMTADRWNSLVPKLVPQETDLVVNNSTVYVPTEISFTPEPNGLYFYQLLLSYSTSGNGAGASDADMKWRWDCPGAILVSFTQAVADTATGSYNAPQEVIFRRPGAGTDRFAGGGDSSGVYWSAYDTGTFETDGTLTPITIEIAQLTAAPEDTILRGGYQTRLIYQRLE